MPTNPPPNERYRQAWARMGRTERRRVLRAVNRVQALDDPAEAALAVVFAQRQRRLWTRWWWVLPIGGGLIALPAGLEAALANIALAAVFVGILAALFSWRAGRAVQINQEVVNAAQKSRRSGSPQKRTRGKKRTGGKPRK
jgi:hypothetical protein